MFWKNESMYELSEVGEMIEKSILEIEKYYIGIGVEKYVVMPDHVHMIIKIVGADSYICPNKNKWHANKNGQEIADNTGNKIVGDTERKIVGADSYICPGGQNDMEGKWDVGCKNNMGRGILNNMEKNFLNNTGRGILNNKERKWDSARTGISLCAIIQRFKIFTTNKYIRGVKNQNWPGFYKRFWQRNYYERIIRNYGEYRRICKYIDDNPDTFIHKNYH